MRTIGRRYPRRRANGDYTAECAYCGVTWHRSRMTKDAGGKYVCPDEGSGRDATTLDRLNAASAGRRTSNHGGSRD